MTFPLDRYKKRQTEEYGMEVVTPMFLGGAEKVNRQIRPASIKGVLRFWWRAVYGPHFSVISDMRAEENKIFGSTDQKSNVDVHVLSPEDLDVSDRLPNYNIPGGRTEVFGYLGFGASNGEQYINPGSQFQLRLRCISEEYLDQVKHSFYCLCNFGGLGSKSRNGFGCMNYKKMNMEFSPGANPVQDFTAFSRESLLFKDKEQKTWEKALGRIGQFYIEARKSIKPTERRQYIAKPLPQKRIMDRYAKPYFLHVNKLEEGKFQGQILFLPSSDHREENSKRVLNQVNAYFAKNMKEVTL